MINSKTFDRDKFVRGGTEVGLALPIVEALADEFAYLHALRRGEITDAGSFDKDQCVQRLTKAGLALRFAEFLADEWAHIYPLLRGQRDKSPSPGAERANP